MLFLSVWPLCEGNKQKDPFSAILPILRAGRSLMFGGFDSSRREGTVEKRFYYFWRVSTRPGRSGWACINRRNSERTIAMSCWWLTRGLIAPSRRDFSISPVRFCFSRGRAAISKTRVIPYNHRSFLKTARWPRNENFRAANYPARNRPRNDLECSSVVTSKNWRNATRQLRCAMATLCVFPRGLRPLPGCFSRAYFSSIRIALNSGSVPRILRSFPVYQLARAFLGGFAREMMAAGKKDDILSDGTRSVSRRCLLFREMG